MDGISIIKYSTEKKHNTRKKVSLKQGAEKCQCVAVSAQKNTRYASRR
jgi:hypothetical protein